MPDKDPPISSLLAGPPRVINIGLESFAADLRQRQVALVDLDWAPPRVIDPKLAALLAKLGN